MIRFFNILPLLCGLLSACQTTSVSQNHIFGEKSFRPWTTAPGLQRPLPGPVTSVFGPRSGRFHYGVDIKGKRGEAILSAGAGRVLFSGRQRGYGRVVIIVHRHHRTLYAHCHELKVSKGQLVRAGQVIATVGASGNARGNHLHFEIQNLRGKPVDPTLVIKDLPARLVKL